MSANGQGSPEDIFDRALEELLAGAALEDVVARHPEVRDRDLEPLLSTARAVQLGPHPELPRASLAAIVSRAQSYARSTAGEGADAKVGVLPTLAAGASIPLASPIRVPGKSRRAPAPTRIASSWLGRLLGWVRPAAPAMRAATLFAVLLLAVGGLLIFARSAQKTPVIAVPTFTSVGFAVDGAIEDMSANRWTVGGMVIQVERNTRIEGVPVVGAQAHIEGNLISSGQRVATSITILQPVAATSPTANLPSVVTPVVIATPPPGHTPTGEAPSAAFTPAPQTGSSTPTKDAASATSTASPTARVGAVTAPSSTPRPSATRVPATSTSRPTALPTRTRTPEPTHTATYTRTVEPSPTEQPSPTETSTETAIPTWTPQDTPTVQATSTPEPSDTPERKPTNTRVPAVTRTPTTQPASTPTSEPTDEPHETWTAVPRSTRTPASTPTTAATPSHEPDETRTVRPTSSPEETPEPGPSPTKANR